MRNYNNIAYLAEILVIIGALNWGLIGLFNFNLVSFIFAGNSLFERILYTLVGLAGVYLAFYLPSWIARPQRMA